MTEPQIGISVRADDLRMYDVITFSSGDELVVGITFSPSYNYVYVDSMPMLGTMTQAIAYRADSLVPIVRPDRAQKG